MALSLQNKKLVVWEGRGPHCLNNGMFKREVVRDKWYRFGGPYIYDRCLERGIQLITPDIYFSLSPKPTKAIYVRSSSMIDFDSRLKDAGVKYAVLIADEHPLYACRLYWNLKKYTRDFDYVYMLKGAKNQLAPNTKFREWHLPHAYSARRRLTANFKRKKYLTLINSNHRVHRLRRLYVNVMNTISPLPGFVNREGYVDRLEAIRYFSKYSDFDLYGTWWDKPARYTGGKYDSAIRACYRGEVYDKCAALEQYKFSLVIENSFFVGGMSEKIIDSLFAGCVPVYWGAPDITDYVPEGAFIDFRKFNCDYARLNEYLRNMNEITYNGYIAEINAFVASKEAYDMGQEKFASDLIKIFESYF
jgi:hypothetical protein